MEYRVQVGKIAFLLETPFPYHWTSSDKQFLGWNDLASKVVYVKISIGKIIQPEILPTKISEWTTVWEQDNKEIRTYKAAFWPGYPTYAMSQRQGDRIDIIFCGDISIWNHPNMQLWNLIHLENYLLEEEGIVLHSCYTLHNEKAILFSAPSGTGKTTQANLWKDCYRSEIINGDKCLLQYLNGKWMAMGYPYHGSADECQNRNYPIEAIVVVRQSKEDYIQTLNYSQKLSCIYSECTVNTWNSNRVNLALDLLSDLIQKVPIIKLHCTVKKSAACVLHDYLYGGKNGTV